MFLPWFQIFLEIWSMEELISLYTNQSKRLPPSAYPNTPHHRPPTQPSAPRKCGTISTKPYTFVMYTCFDLNSYNPFVWNSMRLLHA